MLTQVLLFEDFVKQYLIDVFPPPAFSSQVPPLVILIVWARNNTFLFMWYPWQEVTRGIQAFFLFWAITKLKSFSDELFLNKLKGLFLITLFFSIYSKHIPRKNREIRNIVIYHLMVLWKQKQAELPELLITWTSILVLFITRGLSIDKLQLLMLSNNKEKAIFFWLPSLKVRKVGKNPTESWGICAYE